MMRLSLAPLFGALCVVLTLAMMAGSWWAGNRIAEQKREIAYLTADIERLRVGLTLLEEESAALARDNAALHKSLDAAQSRAATVAEEKAALEREVMETMVPREVSSSADFPVERGMARSGERLADFAARENTSVEVLKALNPWLDDAAPMKAFQTLWLPVKR